MTEASISTLRPNPFHTSRSEVIDKAEKIKQAVATFYNLYISSDDFELREEDVIVVWFSDVLQNWKAAAITCLNDGRYYELSYNGNKRELLVDVFLKEHSGMLFPDFPSQLG